MITGLIKFTDEEYVTLIDTAETYGRGRHDVIEQLGGLAVEKKLERRITNAEKNK